MKRRQSLSEKEIRILGRINQNLDVRGYIVSIQMTLEKLTSKGLVKYTWGNYRLTFAGEKIVAWLEKTGQFQNVELTGREAHIGSGK